MYFTLTISMYQGKKMDLKNVLLLVFLFKVQKASNLWALLTRSENVLFGNIFTSLCCNCDTKHTCERSFQLTKPNFYESNVNIRLSFRLNFCSRRAKAAILLFVGFLKLKYSRTIVSLILEKSLPNGFSWQNMTKSVISFF